MNPWTIFILLALAATISSFICGVSSMVVDGEISHASSEQWMFRRVGFQILTAVLVLIAFAA